MQNSVKTDNLGGVKAWFSWVLAVSFVVMVFALQTGYAVTNFYVAESLALSLVQVGIVGSIYTWVFAITQFASGSILDRFGARVLPIACLMVAVGAFAFANAPGIGVLLLAQVLIAIGASFGFIGAGFVGGLWFEPIKYGFMFSLVQFAASTSAVIGQQTINSLITQIQWDDLINGMGLITLIIAIMLFVFLRNPSQSEYTNADIKRWQGIKEFFDSIVHSLNEVAAIKDSWINCLIGGATFGTMLALGVVWGPRTLVAMGLSPDDAAFATSMSWCGLAVGAPVFSWLSDKMKNRKKPMFMGCLMQFIVMVVFLSLDSFNFSNSSVLFFLWGFAAGGSMIPFAIAAELVDGALIGTSAALVNATQFIVGGIMMALPGQVLSGEGIISRLAISVANNEVDITSDYRVALMAYPLALFLALGLFLFLKETYPSTEAEN